MLIKIKIYWLKFIAFLETVLSMLVYNFHKHIKGVASKNNIKYKENASKYNKFDIHYIEKDQREGKKSPIFIYFHGGGWTNYTKHIFTTLTRRIADMGVVVFNCNYSLSPKNKFDDIMNDAAAAVKHARRIAKEYGGDPDQIFFGGDSSGAHISAMLQVYANENKLGLGKLKDKIKGLVLFYGVYDLKTSLKSKFINIKTYISAVLKNEIGTIDAEKEMEKFSPLCYDISGFAPTFIASGAIDRLHKSQSYELSKQLLSHNIKHKNVFFDDKEFRAVHAFMIIDGISTNVKVLEELRKFIKGI